MNGQKRYAVTVYVDTKREHEAIGMAAHPALAFDLLAGDWVHDHVYSRQRRRSPRLPSFARGDVIKWALERWVRDDELNLDTVMDDEGEFHVVIEEAGE